MFARTNKKDDYKLCYLLPINLLRPHSGLWMCSLGNLFAHFCRLCGLYRVISKCRVMQRDSPAEGAAKTITAAATALKQEVYGCVMIAAESESEDGNLLSG